MSRKEKVVAFMMCANTTEDVALAYLEAEEWLLYHALEQYRMDKTVGVVK